MISRFDANLHRDLQRILDDTDLNLDQRRARLAGLLHRLEPALLEKAAWEDEGTAQAFLEFVAPADPYQDTRSGNAGKLTVR